MNASIWHTQNDDWAVCEGPAPIPVKGYIGQHDGRWRILNDDSSPLYLDIETAAGAVLKVAVSGTMEFIVSRGGELQTVRTRPELIESLKKDGWTVVTRPI